MRDQIALNGAPVVGFGDEESEKRFSMVEVPVIACLTGTVGAQ